jgi:hypothetical protein
MTTATPAPTAIPARRFRADRRDVRLALGVLLVVASVVLGSRVVASADDRIPVWSLRSALAGGTTLTLDDVEPAAVSLEAVDSYVPVGTDVVGGVLTRDVGAGELLPAGAVGVGRRPDRRLVTIPVDPLHAPPGLARGERVDVYVTPSDPAADVVAKPTLVLARALVADPGISDTTGVTSQIGVVLDVASNDAARAVSAARGGDVDLVRVGGAS